ncbi:MAG: ribosome maturation factor RimM [Desulfatiglandales bacterium]
MNDIARENLLLIGKVIRPHGLMGQLRIWSYAESHASLSDVVGVFLEDSSGEIHNYEVITLKPHKRFFLMSLRGLTSLEEAEKYRGAGIYIDKRDLKATEEHEYFWHELIGLAVYLKTGPYIGTLSHILPTGAHDIYVVREGEKEILIPAIQDVVKEIDLTNGRVIIEELEGLLDLNEV